MEYGIYLSAAGALAAESRLDVVANNLANADTPGFKRGYTLFQERLTEAFEPPSYEPSRDSVLDRIGGGLFVHEVAFDRQNGALYRTEGEFDVGLVGEGWFAVRRDGETLYTRAGNFQRGSDGRLRTADASAEVLDIAGKPIELPGAGLTLIDERGTLFVDDVPIARLALAGGGAGDFTPAGDNLHRREPGTVAAPATARVMHKFLERSTVSPVEEMVAMIRTFRAYEANQRMILQQDQTLGRAVNDVGRLG